MIDLYDMIMEIGRNKMLCDQTDTSRTPDVNYFSFMLFKLGLSLHSIVDVDVDTIF